MYCYVLFLSHQWPKERKSERGNRKKEREGRKRESENEREGGSAAAVDKTIVFAAPALPKGCQSI